MAQAVTGSSTRVVRVSTGSQLSAAMKAALPGDSIVLAPNTYTGAFDALADHDGTATRPIYVTGPRTAILKGTKLSTGNGILAKGDYWVFQGFQITGSLGGVAVINARHVTISSLWIHDVGQAAINPRVNSTYTVIKNNLIQNTGRYIAEYGEGVYVGSSPNSWCARTNCNPDKTNYTEVTGNVFGPGITVQNVDVKPGTTGGIISGNTFSGVGFNSTSSSSDWVTMSGTGYLIENNTGSNAPKIGDGYRNMVANGYGFNNTYRNNKLSGGGAAGYGFNVSKSATGIVIKCSPSTTVTGFAKGFSNRACTP